MVRIRYGANQVIWDCKNYESLSAEDFHQANYYMNDVIGSFSVIAFRGDVQKHYYGHVRRIFNDGGGLVLLLGERDLKVFLRQARKGEVSEDHIRDRYDETTRMIG